MKRNSEIQKIAFVGDYLPRKCGIATFTYDICTSVATQYPGSDCFVVPVNDRRPGIRVSARRPGSRSRSRSSTRYLRAADFLNFANTDIVCLQHEYGIFGGPAGSHILGLLRDLRMPVVTTLHTVLKEPDTDQRRVLDQLAELSARLVVMSERAKTFLREIYGVPDAKIDLIPHGIPDMPFVDPNFYKDQFGVEGKLVALTFGLLSPNKGIEHMLRAMPAILKEFPNFVYIVLGATHPDLLREQGERYRLSLERLAQDLGIKQNVIFYNRFVELDELIEFIGAADIYVTPYLNPRRSPRARLPTRLAAARRSSRHRTGTPRSCWPTAAACWCPLATQKAWRERSASCCVMSRGARDAQEGVPAGPGDDLEPSAHLYMESFQRARRSRQDCRTSRWRSARSRSSPWICPAGGSTTCPDDRFDRYLPTRDLHDPQLRRGLLYRRQCPCARFDRPLEELGRTRRKS